MNFDPKAQRIVQWRETFETLPDDYFFEIVRMYLGEIKTPYNKHKLIEDLSAFLRKEENRQNLINFLSDDDLKIITAARIMPSSTQEKLSQFFMSTFSVAIFYERLENLQERLILYTHKNKLDGREVVDVNPLLEDVLAPYENGELLLPKSSLVERNSKTSFTISPQFIASFVSYVNSHGDLCKADGSFKKKTAADLEEIYGNTLDVLQLLVKAFINLNVFHYDDKEITVDKERLKLFALLSPVSQYAYIAVSSCIHLSRKPLQTNAQLLINTLRAVDPDGYTKENILRLSLILKEKINDQDEYSNSRFARIMSRASGEDFADGGMQNAPLAESMMDEFIDSCVVLGLLNSIGATEDGTDIYVASPCVTERPQMLQQPKVLNIDSGFLITLMPGLQLKQLVPLMNFMDIVRYDTAATFEINRKSVMRCFDMGENPDYIFNILSEYSLFEVPQNLRISIEEWYSSYSSACLYRGYVLKVSQENFIKTQKNPVLEQYIREVLAPGVFLLNFKNDDEAKLIIQKSGLDFIGEIKTAEVQQSIMPYAELGKVSSDALELFEFSTASPKLSRSSEEQKRIMAELKSALNELDATKEQKEGLLDRINRKIIVNPLQLRPGSVKFERLEALGIDYTGKIHIIESAIQNNCMLEIESEDSSELLIGTPLSLNKKTGNAELIMDLEPDHIHKVISVSGAVRIKKIRTRHITF